MGYTTSLLETRTGSRPLFPVNDYIVSGPSSNTTLFWILVWPKSQSLWLTSIPRPERFLLAFANRSASKQFGSS
jgi:hypothetical protein